MSRRLFGTDGVRGIANRDLDANLAFHLAYSAAHTVFERNQTKAKIIIGRDTRISGPMFEAALAAGFTAAGADVYLAGIIPTPGIAYLVRDKIFDMGVMISASHNTYEYNGLKIFDGQGFKLPDEVEDLIEANLNLYDNVEDRPINSHIGLIYDYPDAAREYKDHLEEIAGLDLTGMKLALDLANGAAISVAPELFSDFSAELHILGDEADGLNINENCGSTHVDRLAEFVKSNNLDLGLAFDGDADRLIAVDDLGQVMDGDVMLAIMAKDMQEQGTLAKDTLVATVMSNIGLSEMAEKSGISLEQTKVGDRYVLENMLKGAYSLGGEQSGHMIFLEDSTTGDGILSALKLLAAYKRSGQKLSDLRKIINIFPQVLLNVPVPESNKILAMEDAEVQDLCRKIETKLLGKGRVLLRPSGTEPKIRVMLEGQDKKELTELAHKIADLISKKYGN